MKYFIIGIWSVLLISFSLTSFADESAKMVFSEIAWMGTTSSANDEWIEIFNPTDQMINLTDWQIKNTEESFTISLQGTIAPQGYFLLERTDDTTVSNVNADQIYTGALKNGGDVLVLLDSSGQIIDQVDQWHAGDNNTKATMERIDFNQLGTLAENWCTNNQSIINSQDADGNALQGTPRQANSCQQVNDEPIMEPVEEPEEEEENDEPVEEPAEEEENNEPIMEPVEEETVEEPAEEEDEPVEEPVEEEPVEEETENDEPIMEPVEEPVEEEDEPVEEPVEEEPVEEETENDEPIMEPVEDELVEGNNNTEENETPLTPGTLQFDSEPTVTVEPAEGEPAEVDEPIEDGNELVENDEPGYNPAPSLDEEVEEQLPTYQLIINEVMNGSEVNPEKDDWLELYNPGDTEIMLTGWQLQGVTAGGQWIDITTDETRAIQPKSYFVVSHYTDSSSSALAVDPQINKASILFSEEIIQIELNDPDGNLADVINLESIAEEEFYSFERNWPVTDGRLAENWSRATLQLNLKEDLTKTFATPNAANSNYQPIGEVQDFTYSMTDDALILEWTHPPEGDIDQCRLQGDGCLQGFRLYQLNAEWDDWDLLENIVLNESGDIPSFLAEGEKSIFRLQQEMMETAFKITTIDIFGRESSGEELWIIPEVNIVINEILPNPKTKEGENEFIEIWNAGNVAVDLWGWEIDDEKLEDDKSYFFIDEEKDYLLLPGEYLTLYRPDTLISLGNKGDGIYLFDADGNEVDAYFYAPDLEGRSWGRDSNNLDNWLIFNHPTPGAVNIEVNNPPVAIITIQGDTKYMHVNVTGADSYDSDNDDLNFLWTFEPDNVSTKKNPKSYTYNTVGEKTIHLTVTDEFGLFSTAKYIFNAVEKAQGKSSRGNGSVQLQIQNYPNYKLINEIMVNPFGKDNEGEWIELYNNNSNTIDLSGWYLDDADGASRPFRIPDNTHIGSGNFLVIHALDLKLSLKNSTDQVRLLDPNKTPKEIITYDNAQENQTYAKNEQGEFVWTPLLTPNASNQFPLPPKSYAKGTVVIESVLPNPHGQDSESESITLRNTLTEIIDLKDWYMKDEQKKVYKFGNLTLMPQIVHAIKRTEFQLNLNNKSDTLQLYDPAGNLIDEIKWQNALAGQHIIKTDHLQDGLQVSVLRVIDGDTLVVDLSGHPITVRMIGVNTPETVHPFRPVEYFGRQASNYLKNLLTNKIVTLNFEEKKIDKYSRLLAYVYLEDNFVNAELVRQGFGYAYTRFSFKYREDFKKFELEAKENKKGIWQNQKIRRVFEDEQIQIEDIIDEDNIEEIKEEKLLVIEEIEKDQDIEIPLVGAENFLPLQGECVSPHLKIDSIFPNPQKGEGVEYIRLINTGAEKICLQGWILDDVLDKGSKPFNIKGGAIAAGAKRTFRKKETKINLNNKDDCAFLIDPNGKLMDQICYEKTHKKEVFTHTGGDWQPKKRKKKTKSKVARRSKKSTVTKNKKKRTKFRRETIAYQWELINNTLKGIVQSIDSNEKVIYFTLENQKTVPISYAGSAINISMAKELLDFGRPVTFQFRDTGGTKQLVAIDQNLSKKVSPSISSRSFIEKYILFLPFIIAGLYLVRRKML